MGQNPMKMLRQVQEMQAKMQKVQQDLETLTVEGSAGGGVVKVVATGAQKIVSVEIDPDAAGEGVELLQDLVVAATNDALERSRQLAAEKMQGLTAGLGLPPGLLG